MAENILTEEKILDDMVKENIEKSIHLSFNDLVWLNSRGGRGPEDVDEDKQGRKYIKDYKMPVSGKSANKEFGRTYLPDVYSEEPITSTNGFRLHPDTGKIVERWG